MQQHFSVAVTIDIKVYGNIYLSGSPESINSIREIYSADVVFLTPVEFHSKKKRCFLVRGCSQVFGVLRSHLAVSAIPPIGD